MATKSPRSISTERPHKGRNVDFPEPRIFFVSGEAVMSMFSRSAPARPGILGTNGLTVLWPCGRGVRQSHDDLLAGLQFRRGLHLRKRSVADPRLDLHGFRAPRPALSTHTLVPTRRPPFFTVRLFLLLFLLRSLGRIRRRLDRNAAFGPSTRPSRAPPRTGDWPSCREKSFPSGFSAPITMG